MIEEKRINKDKTLSSNSHMHQCYTTTICIEIITRPYLVSYQCELPLLI